MAKPQPQLIHANQWIQRNDESIVLNVIGNATDSHKDNNNGSRSSDDEENMSEKNRRESVSFDSRPIVARFIDILMAFLYIRRNSRAPQDLTFSFTGRESH